MPSTCEFQLNSPTGAYFSGQIVSGSIILNTTCEENVKNIRISILGKAKVSWTESRPSGKHTVTDYFKSKEVYVDNTTTVRGEGVLPPGTYTYAFNIPLPISCPTSFEGKYGHIRYCLRLIVDRPYRFDNEFSKPLTVERVVDLNLNPAFRPIQSEEISSIGCWPCASGEISYNLTLPFGAYAPGQTLRYTLLVQNQSMTDISGYNVELNECITYIAQSPRHKKRKKNETLVNQKHSDSCERLKNCKFEGGIILPIMLMDSDENAIIRVRHSMELEMIVDGCHSNNTMSLPIFIGNVPISESLMTTAEAPRAAPAEKIDDSFIESTPSAPSLPPSPADGNKEPPSFEEVTRSQS